ncbi:MAG: hypothetical protein ACLQLH_01640 [Terracidiphilus sp.]
MIPLAPEIRSQDRTTDDPYSRVQTTTFLLALIFVGLILIGLILSILKLNDGTFLYTMDDPYITLALSDQISHGNYGVNTGLHAAPASSILFSFLLAAAARFPIHQYFPLIINCLALFVTLWIVWRFFQHLRLAGDTFGWVVQAIALVLLAVCLNLIAVVFCGAEHSLHIMATAACIYGLALFLDKGEMHAWLPAVIVLAPLLRYEGLPLSIGALLILALRGYWRTAAGSFASIVLLLGSFSAFLLSMKLPPISSSILTKSDVAANGVSGSGAGLLQSIGWNILLIAIHPVGLVVLTIGVAAAVRCYKELPARPWRWTSHGLMALGLVCLVDGYAAGGRFGGLDRYEDYVLLGTAMMGIYLSQNAIRDVLVNKKIRLVASCATALFLVILCFRYIRSTRLVPLESNNIYEQQFQMHRFVNDYYRAPVAVNDLGLVSYRNPNFVLDLGGLASEEARRLRFSNASADAYRDFIGSHGVHLVIIYDEWFVGRIPASWTKVACMALSRERISPAMKEVQFYATDAFTTNQLEPELQAFSKSLPPRVKLIIYNTAVNASR